MSDTLGVNYSDYSHPETRRGFVRFRMQRYCWGAGYILQIFGVRSDFNSGFFSQLLEPEISTDDSRTYLLRANELYFIHNTLSTGKADRFFAQVKNGELLRLSKEEARRCAESMGVFEREINF